MGYEALKALKVNVPKSSNARGLRYAQDAIAFIREDCKNLKFSDKTRSHPDNKEGKSFKKGVVPYNMERDLDRLCLENAIARFVKSGTREDAFDIYYCYCEIFKPFGEGSDSARLLLDLLSEHETNASSLLSSHRDHYSHSVYVFLTGLAIFRKHNHFCDMYVKKYGLEGKPKEKAAHHFLEYWGLTSLFHDIGYPFEIAFQQIKGYSNRLKLNAAPDKSKFDTTEKEAEIFATPLGKLDQFFGLDLQQYDKIYSPVVTSNLREYEKHIYGGREMEFTTLPKSIGDVQVKDGSEYLDHAYFGALTIAKTYMHSGKYAADDELVRSTVQDCLCAIMLHNSLFKYTLRDKNNLNTTERLSLEDGVPLAYLLMLCDEMQSWDRKSYGQETRAYHYPNDFDLKVTANSLSWTYYFDAAFAKKVKDSKVWKKMSYGTYEDQNRNEIKGCKFLDDINGIICLQNMIPEYDSGMSEERYKKIMSVKFRTRQLRSGVHFSSGNYMNLYRLAVALNGRYQNIADEKYFAQELKNRLNAVPREKLDERRREKVKKELEADIKKELKRMFDEDLSLEYRLSNITQAKGFAAQLHSIGCFYTDRPMDSDPVTQFQQIELDRIARSEHDRWCREKLEMGWTFSEEYKGDKLQRDRHRRHPDLIPYDELPEKEKAKNGKAMNQLLSLLDGEGLTVYHF